MNHLDSYIDSLLKEKRWRDSIVSMRTIPAREAANVDIPEALHPDLLTLLHKQGIRHLYGHQAEAITASLKGENLVISTGVASGKSLCYQLPILNKLLSDKDSTALLIFPTKALAQDQTTKLTAMTAVLYSIGKHKISSAIYDGDTPAGERSRIRKSARILFSNPDMLHLGILPHHTMWSSFFAHLNYVVIDEAHYYRGVFGSHFANVLRRLKRICKLYGCSPQFILTSATLGNAGDFANTLIEARVKLISSDASPQGERLNLIINPPMIDTELGIRRSSMVESAALAREFIKYPMQAILFSVSRRSVEMLLLRMLGEHREQEKVFSYRSGYLPEERRQIEQDLRSGRINLVISTNALELGIDIGGLDAVFINGYPGTISATRQEAGRAGRKANKALSILVAGSNPLDQYICRHPEYLWDSNPEQALIDPNNTEILLKQLTCAVSELSMRPDEAFGSLNPTELSGYLQVLAEDGLIRLAGSRYVGILDAYPAAGVSLRNASNQYPIMADGEVIGYVDAASALWMTHPNAIYLHAGETWIVRELDLEKNLVQLQAFRSNYYTQALRETELNLTELKLVHNLAWGKKYFGNVRVISRITGFKKLRFGTQEVLGYEDLDLPDSILDTSAWWFSLNPQVVENIRTKGLWNSDPNDYGRDWKRIKEAIRQRDNFRCKYCGAEESGRAWDVHHIVPFRKFSSAEEANNPQNLITLCPRCHHLAEQQVQIQSGLAGLAYLLWNLAPFFVMCDPANLERHSETDSALADCNAVIAIYDMIPGGIGLSRKLYDLQDKLFRAALDQVSSCTCQDGCPSCVGPVAENGAGAKEHVQAILTEIIG